MTPSTERPVDGRDQLYRAMIVEAVEYVSSQHGGHLPVDRDTSPSPAEFGRQVANHLARTLCPEPMPAERETEPLPEELANPVLAIDALEAKIAADLDAVKLMRALQAALREHAGLPEETVVDPDKPVAIIRIGTTVMVRLDLPEGQTAVLHGTAVNLTEKKLGGRRAVDIELYDGALRTGPTGS